MCGRYVSVIGEDGIARLIRSRDIMRADMRRYEEEGRVIFIGETERPGFTSYNIAPTQHVLVVVSRNGRCEIDLARWSLVPSWWDIPENESEPPE